MQQTGLKSGLTREPDLSALRRLAENLARERGQRPTTTHLLAAVASGEDEAARLLLDRRLDVDIVLRAARVTVDDSNDALSRALERAREVAARTGTGRVTARSIHLLFALCQETGTAAHRALVQCGTDVTRLRTAAIQLALGFTSPRRQIEVSRPRHDASTRPAPLQRAPSSREGAPAEPTPARPRVQWRPAPPPTPKEPSPADARSTAPPRGPRPTPTTTPRPIETKAVSVTRSTPKAPAAHEPPRARTTSSEDARGKRRDTPAAPMSSTVTRALPPPPRRRFALDPKQTPLLVALGRNLTELATQGKLDPVVGRDAEIERALDVLAKRHASNACLIGAPGVGKTSVARGLAQRIADGVDVACFEERIVLAIEPSAMLAGTSVRGSLAERVAQLKTELTRTNGRVIVFFDEVHVLFGQDAGDEAASELRLALSRGEIVCIGATTEADYRRVIDSDPALSRCFTPLEVAELSPEDALLAIERVAPLFEKHHGCTYEPKALAKAVTWSVRYVPSKALPDKAVQILDLAGARVRRRGEQGVSPEHVAEVVSELTGVPEERLLETDAERLLRLEELMGARIVGHRKALERIATVLRRNASGFRSRRPIGTFLLLGPTGVGKTETAKAIAECLFFSADAMTRLDLSEYAESHALARLVGAPPGYVGHDAGGQLTETIRRRPYQVVLLDEIEKAHRDVLEGFLQVFDEGRLTDGRGRTVDFTNTVIILTSNIGAELTSASKSKGIGFTAPDRDDAVALYQEAVTEEARRALPPELYNRLDEVLAFGPLSRDDVAEVARRILKSLAGDLERARGVRLDVSPAAVDVLLDGGGFDAELGARPMRRAIGRQIEAPIAEMILKGELHEGDVATVDVEDGALVIDAVTP